eukprot:5202-Eustigmatos_ZCMA.PRE.1
MLHDCDGTVRPWFSSSCQMLMHALSSGLLAVLSDRQVRKKVNTLLIIDVHARDIVSEFVRESVLNSKEFAWESQ